MINEKIAVAQFPVYGVVGRPLGLTCYGLHEATGYDPSLALDYTSSRYPSYPNEMLALRTFRVLSAPSRIAGLHQSDSIIDMVIQEQEQPVREPFLWEGSLSIAETLFHGKMRYYATPLKLSEYHLVSEKSYMRGYANGPSCDELIELLEGLEVLNGRDELIRQQYTSH